MRVLALFCTHYIQLNELLNQKRYLMDAVLSESSHGVPPMSIRTIAVPRPAMTNLRPV